MADGDAHLSETQRRIIAALEEKRSDLADMYISALDILNTPSRDVRGARTRISYICHSMREVMNRVLSAMGRPTAPRIKPSTGDQIQKLPDLLAKFPDLDLEIGEDYVPVPRDIATAMASLFRSAVGEKRRRRDDVAALLTDDGNADHAAVTRWNDTQKFFVKWAHLHGREDPIDVLPTDEELRAHIAVVEALLEGVITEFFEARHSIDDLLAAINATQGDEDA